MEASEPNYTDPEVAQGHINITNDADQCAARLTAFQEWVRGFK
jgi:hypothetical protein